MRSNQRLARLERARRERLGDCPACHGRGPVHTFYVRPVGWEQSPDRAEWEDRAGSRNLTGCEHPPAPQQTETPLPLTPSSPPPQHQPAPRPLP